MTKLGRLWKPIIKITKLFVLYGAFLGMVYVLEWAANGVPDYIFSMFPMMEPWIINVFAASVLFGVTCLIHRSYFLDG